MLSLRRTLFYIFVLVYLIVCPLTLLYAFGYLVKPRSPDGQFETGLIFLSSSPAGATIYVQDRRFTQKTPASLGGMLPQLYKIKLSLAGYQPWEATVKVWPKKAVVFDKILLIPRKWKPQELSEQAFKDIISIPSARFFILTKGERIEEYFSYDTKDEKITPFISNNSSFAGLRVLSKFKVDSSPVLILRVRSTEGEKFLWVRQEDDYVDIKNISTLFTESPSYLQWDASRPKEIFSFQNNTLNKLDLVSRTSQPDYLRRLRGFGLFRNKIYILRDINTLLRLNYDRSDQEILLDNPILGNFLFGQKGFFKVKPLTEEIIIFLGEKGELLSNQAPHRFVEKGVRGVAFDSQSQRLLVWTKDKVGIIDFRHPEDKISAKKTANFFWFYTKGKNIKQAFWVYEGSYVLLQDDDDIFLFELNREAEIEPIYIFKVYRDSSVHYSETTGKLYYLAAATRKLNSLEIIPKIGNRPVSFKDFLKGK